MPIFEYTPITVLPYEPSDTDRDMAKTTARSVLIEALQTALDAVTMPDDERELIANYRAQKAHQRQTAHNLVVRHLMGKEAKQTGWTQGDYLP